MASRLKSGRGPSLVGQLGFVVLLGAALGVGGYLLFDFNGLHAELTCAQCGQHMAQWQQGKVPTKDVQGAIEDHLAHCPGCRDRYHEALERLLASMPLFPGWHAVAIAEHLWSQREQ